MDVTELKLAFNRLAKAALEFFEYLKEFWNNIKELLPEKTYTSKNNRYPLIKRISLNQQVILRKPKIIMARSKL